MSDNAELQCAIEMGFVLDHTSFMPPKQAALAERICAINLKITIWSILPFSSSGEAAMVRGGCAVTKDILAKSTFAGNPAKILRYYLKGLWRLRNERFS